MEAVYPAVVNDHLGVVYCNRKVAYASMLFLNKNSYLRTAMNSQIANLEGPHQCYFADCTAIRDRKPDAFSIIDLKSVHKLETADIQGTTDFGPVLARLNNEWGLAFSELGAFFEFLGQDCAYLNELPVTSSNQLVFCY